MRYLPERFRSLIVTDLKRIRENPLFETFRRDPQARPTYWKDLEHSVRGLKIRDLDRMVTCAYDGGDIQILSARFELDDDSIRDVVDLRSGYSVRGNMIYPVLPRTPGSPHMCLVDERTAIIGSGATLERILRRSEDQAVGEDYMRELFPEIAQFEESAIFRVEGRTADVRYQGVQALFFGESRSPQGYDSRRIVKCANEEAASEFVYAMRRRKADAETAGVGASVSSLANIGLRGGEIVIGAQVPMNQWPTYDSYFRNVILPEE